MGVGRVRRPPSDRTRTVTGIRHRQAWDDQRRIKQVRVQILLLQLVGPDPKKPEDKTKTQN